MKFYKHITIQKWTIHIIPSFDLYFESHSPMEHKRFWKDGLSGLYLDIKWINCILTIGLNKTI